MKSFKDAASQFAGLGGYEVLTTFSCIRCRAVQKKIKTVIMGGPNKGQPLIETTECHCRLSRETAAAAKAAKLKHFKKHWTVNPSIKDATLFNFEGRTEEGKRAFSGVQWFFEKLKDGEKARLVMMGTSGQGKSHLALGAAKYAEQLGKGAIFIEVPTLKQLLQSTFGNDTDLKQIDIFRAFRECDLLVLDDLGSEKEGEWIDEVLFNILNDRLSKPLIITTNLSMNELYQRYHPRMIDRMFEGMGKEDLIKFKSDKSYRMRKFFEDDEDE
ncbi:ATP-binding protein [Domibacillus robiginosus]|uniref:ATP-binding protein n=1 Tax=Domibacillus robiginosus TaxID=1071054 RepID=UPI00067C6DFE|nr:ATP-binding protein [Domibacillus robiginosus]